MNRKHPSASAWLAAMLIAAAPRLSGQAAATPEASPPTGETVILSPFVVDAAEDADSYRATATLAGSRIRTDLKDVGSSVQVVTQKFLEDTASTNAESLLVYTTNTEVAGQGGNFLGQGDGAVLTDTNRLAPVQNTRVRGLAEADNTRDFFLSDIPWDSYNVGRVDLQRGPNSVLFGIGSPAGIVNSGLNTAAFADSNKLEARFGSFGSKRFTGDFNKVLLEDELAVRLALLADHTNYRQDPAFRNDERVYVAARWDPKFLAQGSAHTSFTINFEKGEIRSNLPRGTPPLDAITPWFTDLGKATFDARTAATEQQGNNWYGSPGSRVWDGVVMTFDGERQGIVYPSTVHPYPDPAGNTAGSGVGDNSIRGIRTFDQYANAEFDEGAIGAYKAKSLTDRSIFDFYNNLLEGPNKREWNNFEAVSAALAQTFMDSTLGIKLEYDWQKADWGYANFLSGDAAIITVDTNHTLLDGSPNPHVGRPLTISGGGSAGFGLQERSRETMRATGFYEFDFADVVSEESGLASMLGRHVFTGLYAEQDVLSNVRRGSRFFLSENYPAVRKNPDGTPTAYGQASRDAIFYNYFGPSMAGLSSPAGLEIAGIKDVVTPGDTNIRVWNNVLNAWEDVPLVLVNNDNLGYYHKQYRVGEENANETDSTALVWQAYLFDGNLVPMFGYRKDTDVARSAGPPQSIFGVAQTNDPEWRLPRTATDLNDDQRTWNKVSGTSRTWSVVAHMPQAWRDRLPGKFGLSVFYNESENFQPDASRRDVRGNPVSAPSGETEDYGVAVSLFDDRLTLRWNHYKTIVNDANVAATLGGGRYLIGAVEAWGQQAAVKFRESIEPGGPMNWPAEPPNKIPYGITSDGYQLTWRPPGPSEPFEVRDEADQIIGYTYPQEVIDETFAREKASIDAWFATQVPSDFASYWSMTDYASGGSSWAEPSSLVVTGDTISKGDEFELFANPVPGLDIAMAASKTSAQRTNLASTYVEWIEQRWAEFQGPAGDMRLWGPDDDGTLAGDTHTGETARGKYQRETMASYYLWQALQNSDVPELRPWRFSLVANYSFRSDTRLRGTNIGGSFRWQEASVTGFPVITDSEGVMSFDVNNPYKGDSESIVDFWVGYERRLTEKLSWRIQLNVRNLFADDDLIPVTVQPDGSPAAFRIPEPRTWTISNTLRF